MTGLTPTAHTVATGESVTVLQLTAHTVLQESQLLFYSPHSATGESVTVPLPTQYYKRVSDCSTSPHSATGGSVTTTAHTVLQESQ